VAANRVRLAGDLFYYDKRFFNLVQTGGPLSGLIPLRKSSSIRAGASRIMSAAESLLFPFGPRGRGAATAAKSLECGLDCAGLRHRVEADAKSLATEHAIGDQSTSRN